MHSARSTLFGAAAIALAGAHGQALAQNVSNEAWIGQVGNTNTLVIVQQGESNVAGADNVFLRLNQDGDFNSISIDQFGWSNSVGAILLEPGQPSGVNQVGDQNRTDIQQRNSEPGFNIVGGIFQQSSRRLLEIANTLSILQTDIMGLNGAAGHSIGSVQQVNLADDDLENPGANSANLVQSGGGLDRGNTIGSVFQEGTANSLEIYQAGQTNVVLLSAQIGGGNYSKTEQGGGESNRAEYLQQFGADNWSSIRQSGSRNVVQHVLQNNEYLGGGSIGNRVEAVFSGEDNGGDGLGGVGQFLSAGALALTGVFQSNIVQMGDDNDASLTVTQGSLTKFAIAQTGDGNGALIAISAIPGATAFRNETAVYQNGLDNNFHHTVTGSDNAGAAGQSGQRNEAYLVQDGDGNVAVLSITGDDNNAASIGGFLGPAGAVAAEGPLLPGRIIQDGISNAATSEIEGSRNLFSLSQQGDFHAISMTVMGGENHVAVKQTGNLNVSLSAQSGSGNSLGIRQY